MAISDTISMRFLTSTRMNESVEIKDDNGDGRDDDDDEDWNW